jgi:hypothetical protein
MADWRVSSRGRATVAFINSQGGKSVKIFAVTLCNNFETTILHITSCCGVLMPDFDSF